MNWKTIAIKTGRWMAVGIAAVVILLGVLLGFAQTDFAKRQMARLLAQGLGGTNESSIEVGKIDGFIPFKCHLDRLIVRDAAGELLALEDLSLRWSPVALFRGQFHINELTIALLRLNQLPPGPPPKKTTRKELPTWPSALHRLRLDRLSVAQLALGHNIAGQDGRFKLEARIMPVNVSQEQVTEIQLERTDGPKAEATLNITLKGTEPLFRLHAKVEEAEGGLLAALLGLPGPIALDLDGEGPLMDWKGDLKASLGGLGSLQTRLTLQGPDTPTLNIDGVIKPTPGILPGQVASLLSEEMHFAASLRLPRKQSLLVDHLALDSLRNSLRITGSLDLDQQISNGQFSLRCQDISPLGNLSGLELAGSMAVDGSFSGPIFQPQSTISVKMQNVEAADFRAKAMEADFRVNFLEPSVNGFPGVTIIGQGSIENPLFGDLYAMPEMRLNWNLVAEGPTNDVLRIRKLQLQGEKTFLGLSGRMDLSALNGTGEGTLDIQDLRRFSGLLGVEMPGSTKAQFSFGGNATKRTVSARVQGELTIPEKPSSSFTQLLGSTVSYAGEMRFTEANKVTVSDLQIDALAGKLTGTTSLDLVNEKLDSSFRLVVPKLAVLSPVITRNMGGSLEMDGLISGNFLSPKVKVKAQAKNLIFEQTNFQALTANIRVEGLPPKIQGAGELALHYGEGELNAMSDFSLEGQRLNLSGLSLRQGENELAGNLTLDLQKVLAEGALQGNARNLSSLSSLVREEVAGRAGIKAEFRIVNNEQQATVHLDGRDLATRFGRASKLNITATLLEPLRGIQGTVILEGKEFYLGELTLASLTLTGEGTPEKITFYGKARGHYKESFDMETRGFLTPTLEAQRLLLTKFQARYNDLPLVFLRPAAIERTAKGLRLEALLLKVGDGRIEGSGHLEDHTFSLKTDFEGLPMSGLSFLGIPELNGSATGNLHLKGSPDRPQGSMELRLDGLALRDSQASGLPPATLEAEVELKPDRCLSRLTLLGLTAKPLEAKLDIPLSLSIFPLAWSLPSQGEIHGGLGGEIDLARTGSMIGLADPNIEGMLGFDLALGGMVSNPEIRGGIQVRKGAFRGVRSGITRADIRFQGPLDRPKGNIELRINELTLGDPQASGLPPATVEAKAELIHERLITDVALRGPTNKPMRLKADLPFSLSFSPLSWSLPSGDELRGSLVGEFDLEQINTALGTDYQILKGRLNFDFAMKGTVDRPKISGQGRLEKGYYEYIPSGTVLKDFDMEVTTQIPRVSIKQARGTDGDKGRISLQGWLDLLPADHFPFEMKLIFNKATLVRRDEVTASTEGHVTFSGSFVQAQLGGQLHVENAEIRIPDRLPPEIAELEVIEIGKDEQQAERTTDRRSNEGLKLLLDLEVDSPGKIFMRGRGLDSEWKGALHATGTAHEPMITGNLSVVRGHFNFLGKRFDLRRGSITFSGAHPPSPVIDVVAEATATDITAQLQLSGTFKAPELTLTSQPSLPSDEILSRLLFGRALNSITPFQALRLADAARTLAGGGGPDLMGRTRKMLGVDQLELKTDDQGTEQTSIGAGKYLSDRVYLEVERGLDPQSSKTSVEVEITPHTSFESEVGANSEGGVGLRWKWDY